MNTGPCATLLDKHLGGDEHKRFGAFVCSHDEIGTKCRLGSDAARGTTGSLSGDADLFHSMNQAAVSVKGWKAICSQHHGGIGTCQGQDLHVLC